ncbi:MAG TPA: response regulator [Burkholderiales bacterium]|jgi:CheY-like chemotaxis protein|nr:response regulator [Burkholderiales bacterium]
MNEPRILVADDDADTVLSLTALLRDEGYEVRGVHRGAEVLQAIFHFAPDVVLLDIGMPQMSGYDVARTLRERYGSARPALIAVTGRTAEADRQQARAAGFEHHVGKPYEPRALLRLIGELAAGAPARGAR